MYKMRKLVALFCAVCLMLPQTYVVSYAQEDANMTVTQGNAEESQENPTATPVAETLETPSSTPIQEPFMEQKEIRKSC